MKNQISTLIQMRGLQIVLAITPGLVALLMILFVPEWTADALAVVSAMILIVGLLWKRQIVSWMFPALGIFAFLGPNFLFPHGFSGAEIVLWIIIVLFYAISLLLARQHGLVAGLILVAGMFIWAAGVLETAYGIGGIDNYILTIIPVLFMLIISPIWMLCARTSWAQVVGLLLPGVALLGGEIYKSIVVSGNPYGARWSMLSFYFIPVTISALIYFTIHWHYGRRGASQA